MTVFKLNKEKLDLICKLKGWKYKCSALAKATGFTKAYVSQVLNNKTSLCEGFMLAYIGVAGMNPKNPKEWGSLFKIQAEPEIPQSYQKNNYAKYIGQKPYNKYSLIGPVREKDMAKELKIAEGEEVGLPNLYSDTPKKQKVA